MVLPVPVVLVLSSLPFTAQDAVAITSRRVIAGRINFLLDIRTPEYVLSNRI
jgi:hypothetical protein